MLLLALMMLCLLLRAQTVMAAACAACRLFVTAVLPGLFPYMVLSLMLTSRLSRRMSPALLMLLGWGGGSPTGTRLLPLCPGLTYAQRVQLAVSCATMSPMFLLGTVGGWLDSTVAGAVVLASVIIGGWLSGKLAGLWARRMSGSGGETDKAQIAHPLTFGEAIEQSARTMLLVCGTMVMLRVFAALSAELLPAIALPLTTLLEVTTGAQEIAGLPLPPALRTALIAGATGFGGMAIVMQNRAMYPRDFLPLGMQLLWQGLHGGISFLAALGGMVMVSSVGGGG